MFRNVLFVVLYGVLLTACGEDKEDSPLPSEGEGEEDGSEGEGSPNEGEGEEPTPAGEGEGSVCACASDADCQDGNFCNGVETCNCTCSPGALPDCADEIECTEDRCANNQCVNVPAHARCGAGKICRPAEGGCVAPPPCRDDADCVLDDACQVGACDAATRACAFAPFDGDEDGYAPIVCGGEDCDDSTGAVSPERSEECNEKDDNCDGRVDEGIDFLTSFNHCGGCNHQCPEWFQCVNGDCQCPEVDLTDCGSVCVNLEIDRTNCGQCGRNCQEGEQCVEGRCRCPEGLEGCGLGCVDTQTDRENCGRCENRCEWDADCRNGTCVCLDDNLTSCNGTCVSVVDDPENCGACGNACAEEAITPDGRHDRTWCVDGVCLCHSDFRQFCGGCEGRCIDNHCYVPTGLAGCGDQCVDLANSIEHCGRCGNACDENAICIEGQCEACPNGTMRCDDAGFYCACGECDTICIEQQEVCAGGACVCAPDAERCGDTCPDFQWDAINCGGCENVCPWAEACEEGVCTCYDVICDDRCSMLGSDPDHCGECNHRCGRDEWCVDGQCERCPADIRGRCNGYCTDFQSDPLNCGRCGNECNPYQLCEDGRCMG